MAFLNKIFLFLNYLFAVSLLLSYLAIYVNPATFWPPAFFGLNYPFLLVINVLFVLFWIFRLKLHFLISLLSIAIGYRYFQSTFNVNVDAFREKVFSGKSITEEDNSGKKVNVMSYNVRLFDLYNWKDNKNQKTRNKIFDVFREEKPDILCLQEFYQDDKGGFKTLDSIPGFLGTKYYHAEYTKTLGKTRHWGIITLSRFPVIRKEKIVFGKSNNICILSDIVAGKDTLRIFNLHLASIHFSKEDYELMDNLVSGVEDMEKPIYGRKDTSSGTFFSIFSKLKRGFILRGNQVEKVSEQISASPFPVILCGDFNDTPVSYTYHNLKGDLTDAFLQNDFGIGYTYVGTLPLFRIDFIMHSAALHSSGFDILQDILSDHRAIQCEITINK